MGSSSHQPFPFPGPARSAPFDLGLVADKVGLWDWNIPKNEVTWNDAVYALHGVDRQTFQPSLESFTRLVHPEDLPRVQQAIRDSLERSAPYELEFRVLRPDGQVAWLFANATLVREGGQPSRLIGALLDVTERRHADDRSRWLAAVVDSSDDAIVSKDLNGVITSWNAGAERLFGYTRAEIVGQPVTVLMPDSRKIEEVGILERIRRGERVEHFETVRQRKDGSPVDVSLTISPVKDAAGRIVGASKIARDISDRRRQEAALLVSQERFRLLASHAPVGIFLSDQGGGCVFVNARWSEMTGLTPTEAQGAGWTHAIHPDDRDRVLAAWQQAVERGHPSVEEFRFVRPDRSVVWVHGSAARLEQGGFQGYLGSCLDITQRKQAELQTAFRHDLAERLAALDDPTQIRALSLQALGAHLGADRCFLVNISADATGGTIAQDWHGPGLDDLAGEHRLADCGSPELRDRVMRPQFSIADTREHRTTRSQREGLTRLGIRSLATSAFWLNGRWIYSLVVTTRAPRAWTGAELDLIESVAARVGPLMEQARARQALRRSEQLYRAIGESIDYGIWVCDAAGRNIYASDSFLRLVGLTQQQCAGEGWTAALHPDELDATRAAWQACIRQGAFWERENRFKGADGRWHPVLTRGVPVRDEAGHVLHWVGINLDISALKQVEHAARAGEHQLRLVADHAPVYLAHCDREHRFKFVNEPYAERYGRTREWVVGRHVSELTGREAYATIHQQMDACLAGRRIEFEQEIPDATLGSRWVHVIYEPERGPGGEVIGLVAVIVDITSRKQAEFELARARDEALAASRAKDEFLASLSHELRTPLNPVLLLASDGAGNSALPADVRQAFETIRRNASLEARLIDDLLDLTQITRGELKLQVARVDVHTVLQAAVATLRAEIEAKRLNLQLFLGANQPVVHGDSIRLQQAFAIVLQNAVKFTGAGGQITVVSRRQAESDRVIVEITDNGLGMTAAELAGVFAGFARRERAGSSHQFGGLGLGLSIGRRLVELHGGSIGAASPGRNRGSAFVVELPLAGPETARTGEAAHPGTPAGSSGAAARGASILLVEDHLSTRETLQKLLTRRNYDVVAAGTVREALARAQARPFDVLVSDVGLPDGDGYQLMAAVRGLQPAIRGIALSGYGMEEDLQRSEAGGFATHLVKPVSISSLEHALARLPAASPAVDAPVLPGHPGG